MNSASFLGMGPWPGGPQSLRPAPAATLPGAGRHNQVSWAGITLPSPARPGPGGGPGASEPVRLGAGRGALLSSHSGWAPMSCTACLRHVVAKRPRPVVPVPYPNPSLLQGSLYPAGFPCEPKCLLSPVNGSPWEH